MFIYIVVIVIYIYIYNIALFRYIPSLVDGYWCPDQIKRLRKTLQIEATVTGQKAKSLQSESSITEQRTLGVSQRKKKNTFITNSSANSSIKPT